jgi:predicted PurR-regulated permease PerM
MRQKPPFDLLAPLNAQAIAVGAGQQIDIVRVAAGLVSAAVVIAGLYYGRDVLIPLACAFLIGFALSRPVTWLTRLGLPRILAVITIMLTLIASLGGLGFILTSQLRILSEDLPTYQSTIRNKLSDLKSELRGLGIFDRAIETVETVQEEVKEKPATAGDAPQRVEMVTPAPDPFQTAMTWLGSAIGPLAMVGIVFVFAFLVLLDRSDLRDRLLRMLGGNLHRSTDALEEAGKRISKYLLMQLIVNFTYGIPLAVGLWIIGVPGALLWGTVAAVMRFVPYLGPILSAIFPVALAFAVDPGWNMVLWTIALIVVLELVSNNIIEPLLYGTSTGLSAMSLIAAATFWTALWGPVGLILSTPLTVCLLVIGRNIPQFHFLDILLGSLPALDLPTRLYQRLIADDADEAIEIAVNEIENSSPRDFYNDVGIPVLRLASEDHLRNATAEHRLRAANGMDTLLDDLREQYPSDIPQDTKPRVICIGGKWELDTVAGEMLAHALALDGIPADYRPAMTISSVSIAKLDLERTEVICISYFTTAPAVPARHFVRRLQHRWPHLKIVLALWNSPEELLNDETHQELGVKEVVTSIDEAVARIHRLVAPYDAKEAQKAVVPDNDEERVAALEATGVLSGSAREDLDALATRAAEVFNVGFAVISAINRTDEYIVGQSKPLPGPRTQDGDMLVIPRDEAVCNHLLAGAEALVIPDAERDPRVADNPTLQRWDARFYAGAPLRSADGFVFGALCLLDREPHTLEEREIELLNTMAADVVAIMTGEDAVGPSYAPSAASTATIGQRVPE